MCANYFHLKKKITDMPRASVISACSCRLYTREGGWGMLEKTYSGEHRGWGDMFWNEHSETYILDQINTCLWNVLGTRVENIKIKEVATILFIWKTFIKLFYRKILILCFESNMFKCSLHAFVKIMIQTTRLCFIKI